MTPTRLHHRTSRNAPSWPGRLARAALLFGLVAPATGEATVLRFDQAFDGTAIVPTARGGALPTGYGDRAAGSSVAGTGGSFSYDEQGEGYTPNVVVDLYATAATLADPRVRLWTEGYGSLQNVMFTEGPGIGGAAELFVHLIADPGFEVVLWGFDLAAFGGSDLTIRAIETWAGGSLLHWQTDVLVEGDASHGGYTPVAFATPLSAPELLLRLDLSNLPVNIRDNIGLDNLRFGQMPPPLQPMPAPPVLTLLTAGAMAAWAGSAAGRRPARLPKRR